MMMFSPGASVRVYLPNRSMVQSNPCGTVLMPANSVKITSSTSAMAKTSNPVIKNLPGEPDQPGPQTRRPASIVTHCRAAKPSLGRQSGMQGSTCAKSEQRQRLYPALKLAQNQLPDDVHAGVAIVQTWNRGKLLAAIVLENLGVFLGDFFQRFQTIGGEARRHDGDAARTFFRQPLDGLVGGRLQPLVEAEARLECEYQLGRLEAQALAQRVCRRDALRQIGVALVDIFLRNTVP